jgi:hypothetical protein
VSFLHRSLELTLSFHPFNSFFPCISAYVAGDIPDNVDVAPVDAQVHCGDEFRASNSIDSEPYGSQGLLILMVIILLES